MEDLLIGLLLGLVALAAWRTLDTVDECLAGLDGADWHAGDE